MDNSGAFAYSDSGFTLTFEGYSVTLKWSEITEINVYKKDLLTMDDIRMQIVFGDKQIDISEELPGWFQFTVKLKEVFPGIPKDWDIHIMQPPFETNFRTIYSKPANANP